jgi:hypothetical protein
MQVWDEGFQEPCEVIKAAIDREQARQAEQQRKLNNERNKPDLDKVTRAAKLAKESE